VAGSKLDWTDDSYLPFDIWMHIVDFFDAQGLVTMAKVNRFFNETSNESVRWLNVVRRFCTLPCVVPRGTKSWKAKYKCVMRVSKDHCPLQLKQGAIHTTQVSS
jgi:hypothetical protein